MFQKYSADIVLVWLDKNAITKNQFEVELRLYSRVVRVRFQEKSWSEMERDDTMEFRLNPNKRREMITRSSKQITVYCGGDQPLYAGLPDNVWFEASYNEAARSLLDFLKGKVAGQEWDI